MPVFFWRNEEVWLIQISSRVVALVLVFALPVGALSHPVTQGHRRFCWEESVQKILFRSSVHIRIGVDNHVLGQMIIRYESVHSIFADIRYKGIKVATKTMSAMISLRTRQSAALPRIAPFLFSLLCLWIIWHHLTSSDHLSQPSAYFQVFFEFYLSIEYRLISVVLCVSLFQAQTFYFGA